MAARGLGLFNVTFCKMKCQRLKETRSQNIVWLSRCFHNTMHSFPQRFEPTSSPHPPLEPIRWWHSCRGHDFHHLATSLFSYSVLFPVHTAATQETDTTTPSPAARFFNLASQFPLELQNGPVLPRRQSPPHIPPQMTKVSAATI